MLLDARDEERVRLFNQELTGEIHLRLVTTSDPRSAGFEAFAVEFGALARKVRFHSESSDALASPALIIGDRWCYHALPLSSELDPFLGLLGMLDRGPGPPLATVLHRRLEGIRTPGQLQVFIGAQCPFCPHVVKQILPLPLFNPLLKVTVIDGVLFAEMAQRANVKASPTVILDEEFRWSGQIRLEELVECLEHRDPLRLDTATLQDMLKEGSAAQLAQMMLRRAVIPPAFLPLLVHGEWSVRLGAMGVLEEIAAANRALAQQAAQPLWQQLDAVETNIQGDIIYLLGQIGDRETTLKLKEMLRRPADEQLREALEEAVTSLTAGEDG
jgi:hypothetical protein